MLGQLHDDAKHFAENTNSDEWLIASWLLQFHSASTYEMRQMLRRKAVEYVRKYRTIKSS